ncbi:MAG: PD40 domain-containing protein [Flavobacteriales bacterium]|nr:PD40 domain-containing protein [Flavobacteriales bacterium]
MKQRYATLLCLALVSPCTMTWAQGEETNFLWKFNEANKLMEEKFYNQAAEIWEELVQQDPNNANLNYKLGYSYFNSYNQDTKALPYLEKAAQLRTTGSYGSFNTSGYDPFDPKERNAPSVVDYYLGRAYHLNGDLDKADVQYQKFMDGSDPKHDLHPLAKRGLEQTANARELMKDPKPYEVSNVGAVINSDLPDFGPVISVDGNALFFTTRRVHGDSSNYGIFDDKAGLPHESIYVSYKDREGNWQTPELLNINEVGNHLATINVSADGQTLFIYRSDEGDGNIYESKLVGELWSDPVLMGSDINTKSWETHGALTADGNTFYFVSDRSGGFGGRDLYRVVRLPNGEWSKAQNLGNVVNTKFDEDGAFIHPNGRTLYFSSKGHNSMGGFDVFQSELQEDGTWTPPVNIGYPLNTPDDEVFFVTTADGRRGYFSSDKIGGYGEKDIYFVDLPMEMEAEGLTVLKGFIIPPPGTSLPPSTVLYVTDKESGEVKTYKPRQRDGVYVVILPPCKEYNLDYRVDDKTIHTEDIFVECETAYQEINKEIYLNPVSITGPASIVDLPKGSPPGSKEKGETTPVGVGVVAKTDKQVKEEGKPHVTPDASYAAEYAKYYAYNMKDIDQGEADWRNFVDKVVSLIDEKGKANIVIEASASKVPTKTFGTNENLSRQRMEDAKKRLIEAVTSRGKNPDLMLVEAVNSLVQGPAYRGDYKDTEKYGKFQYVKLKTR